MDRDEIARKILHLSEEGKTLDPEESEYDFFRMEEIFKEISSLACKLIKD